MTTFKWKRFGTRWVVFDKNDPEQIIWDLTQSGNTNADKQQAKKEMKIFLKSIKKKDPVADEQGTETDD